MDNNMFSLNGQTALVTGGASGIGQAIAHALAAAGADIAVTVHQRGSENICRQVLSCGRRFHAIPSNLQNEAAAELVVAETERVLGPVGILVNCAGMIHREDAVLTTVEDFRSVMQLNLESIWLLSQAAGKRMLENRNGKIINIASLLAFQGGIRVPAYTASKHAVVGLTKALSNEWARHNINVNAIAPGYIETSNTAPLREDPERYKQILDRIPAARWGNPYDLAGAAVFLASAAATYIHGHVLAVDGGWLAR